MKNDTKIFFNKTSSEKLGWDPTWFGHNEFDDLLLEKIEKFQGEHKLKVDGLCGEQTYKIVYTERLAKVESIKDKISCVEVVPKKHILCNRELVEIEWEKFVGMNHKNSLTLPKETYQQSFKDRGPFQIIVHHDATLSSRDCKDILIKRGLSVHFSIDNDGTIYQMVDCNDVAWHAKPNNFISVGIEISNAVYSKYRQHYIRKGFGERPVLAEKIHGTKYGPYLGLYPIQVEALKELLKTLCRYYHIPFSVPKGKKLMKDSSKFRGILGHYHINEDKWDPFGLDLEKVVKEIK